MTVSLECVEILVGSDLSTNLCDLSRRLVFQCRNFAQTAPVALGLTEIGCRESLDQVPCLHRSHDPATHTNNVHVIVLDSLSGGEVIVDQGSANAVNLVGTDRGADTATAYGNASLQLACCNCTGERNNKIRIVVA